MNRFRGQVIPGLLGLLMFTLAARGQQNIPRMGYIYPAGGRQGAVFQVVIGGQFLDGVTNVFVSGTGVRATVLEFNKPLTQQQFNALRDQLKELQDKRLVAIQYARSNVGPNAATASTNQVVWTAADEKLVAEIRKKLANPPNRQANPAIAETAVVQVGIAADAEPGDRELRLRTPLGLSNPLIFQVGQLPEFSKPAANASAQPRPAAGAGSAVAETETSIIQPAVVNGQIMPGGVDRFRFQARQGQLLVIAVNARSLIPYLADAVPGWFQATLALYDAKGKELAYDDDYRFNPDPVLHFLIPQDGDYVIEIKDAIYRGREDFVYRITVGEVPFVTDIFPLGGPVGAITTVELTGWNLTTNKLMLDARNRGPGIYPIALRLREQTFNHVPFAVDVLPECWEQQPNNLPQNAQRVTLPIIVNGRVDKPGVWHVFRFQGRAGSEIVAEVNARRLNSPLDSVLKLTDATGKQLAFNDDYEDKSAGLETHHADSYLRVALPADGDYYLYLGDVQQQGGPEFAYRLRISPPRPDFELRVVPSSINLRAGASAPVTIYAIRKDGFTNEIALALKGAPDGFSLSGGRVLANQDQVRLTLTAPPTADNAPISLMLEGRAMIQGREVSHLCVPAEDLMQAFAYRHLVPVRELKVAVSGRFVPRLAMKILSATPVKIPAGGTVRVRVAGPPAIFTDRVQLELNDAPAGITIQNVSVANAGAEIELHSDAAKVKPGQKGNLIINVFPGRAVVAANQRPAANRRPVGTLPAVPFEITAE